MKIRFTTAEGEQLQQWDLLPSQEKFWLAKEPYVLYSGGVGSGKTTIFLLRILYEALSQDDNYILVGRRTYAEIEDSLVKEFLDLCHPSWVESKRLKPHPTFKLKTFNGKTSEIIFRNLDKASKAELLGLNLGGFAIDQAEDIPEEIFLTLKGRLRRKDIRHFCFLTANPKLSWLYRVFKKEPEEGYLLIEASTLENKDNLPESYLKGLEQYPESWYRQYVMGIWDESLLSDNIVFSREYIERMKNDIAKPVQEHNGLKIYKEHQPGHIYQMGVDCAEGGVTTEESLKKTRKDSAVIKIWDHTTDEEVAHWSAIADPRVTAEKAVEFAKLFNSCLIVPEMNSMGLALIHKLEDLKYSNVYRRTEFDKIMKKQTKKMGWRMTAQTKQLLIAKFQELLRKRDPKVRSHSTWEQFKTFVYTTDARMNGAGAVLGEHDDEVIALLLAAFIEGPIQPLHVEGSSLRKTTYFSDVKPTVTSKNGMIPGIPLTVDPLSSGKHVKWTLK